MTADASYKPSSADMLFYYERILPFRYIFQWLNHSPKPTKDFTMREFAFEFSSGAYSRYNSYSGQEDFKKRIVQSNPTRFEVGAVYSANPSERKTLPKLALKPLTKELVFDIDLTDYDEIRTCCSKTDICKKCWKFIKAATKVIDAALRDDFGFNHLIWVFSGRRGAHCWVCDPRARELSEPVRKSIVEYLDVLGSKQQKMGKNQLNLKRPFHPHVERSFDLLKHDFVDIVLHDQDPWNNVDVDVDVDNNNNQEQIDTLLSFLPDAISPNDLKTKWNQSPSSSISKWEDINSTAKKVLKNQSQINALNEAKKDIILYYLYPRLDIEVSKQLIHLLKSPFCIHPSTGNICVPFDPNRNLSSDHDDDDYGFNPINAPNLKVIQDELEIYQNRRVDRESSQPLDDSDSDSTSNANPNRKLADYEKTSLKPYVDYFAKFVKELMKDDIKLGKRQRDDELEF